MTPREAGPLEQALATPDDSDPIEELTVGQMLTRTARRAPVATEQTRSQIIEAGVRLVEREGLRALSARNLAAEVGTSTMTVYSRFGSMSGVLDAVASALFDRFTGALAQVPQSADPVADFFLTGAVYHNFALEHPPCYVFMFGPSTTPLIAAYRPDLTASHAVNARAEWATSFDALRQLVRRMIGAGRIRDDDELTIAGRMWSVIHGEVMLELAGFFGVGARGLRHTLAPLTVDVLVGLGDQREKTNASRAIASSRLRRLPR